MQYKLLALDLDGTLLRRDGSIHPDDLEAIKRVREAGALVTIATGRLYSGSKAAAIACAIDGAVACVDGSHIHHVGRDEKLFYRGIAGIDAVQLRRAIEGRDLACFVFAQDGIVHDERGEAFLPYVRTWSNTVEVVERVTDHPHWDEEEGIAALVAIGSEKAIEGAARDIRRDLEDIAFVVTFPVTRLPDTHAMIVRAAGATKGTAIEFLAEHHGFTTKEVVVVGDWLNDIPMFQVAGRAFVMKQAPKLVKAHATDELEAEGGVGGGVAEAIAKAWGIR